MIDQDMLKFCGCCDVSFYPESLKSNGKILICDNCEDSCETVCG
jgi:hypothetical protein